MPLAELSFAALIPACDDGGRRQGAEPLLLMEVAGLLVGVESGVAGQERDRTKSR
jgi:hypothetical protein